MSGADWFAVTVLAGFVAVTITVDWARDRITRRRHRDDDRRSRQRLLRELERLP